MSEQQEASYENCLRDMKRGRRTNASCDCRLLCHMIILHNSRRAQKLSHKDDNDEVEQYIHSSTVCFSPQVHVPWSLSSCSQLSNCGPERQINKSGSLLVLRRLWNSALESLNLNVVFVSKLHLQTIHFDYFITIGIWHSWFIELICQTSTASTSSLLKFPEICFSFWIGV